MTFVLVAGTTETAIDGISAAGETPTLLGHTPAADAEIVAYGQPVLAPIDPEIGHAKRHVDRVGGLADRDALVGRDEAGRRDLDPLAHAGVSSQRRDGEHLRAAHVRAAVESSLEQTERDSERRIPRPADRVGRLPVEIAGIEAAGRRERPTE